MKNISIIIPNGHFSMVNVEGCHQIFNWVNNTHLNLKNKAIFKIQLVGLNNPVKQTTGLFTIHPDILIDEVDHTDLIILPAIHGNWMKNVNLNRPLLSWLVEQHKKGAEIASLCIGTFFLAETGLLKGKKCSTHWSFANEFKTMYPDIDLQDDKVITDSGGIYSSGGAYSFTNLIIYLIDKYVGREMAILTAKAFMIDIERSSQSPFMMFSGQKTHGDEKILKVQQYLEQHYEDKITVDDLIADLGMGRRTFERRFKKATTNTIVEYMQRVKIEFAKKQLESGHKTVNEVMFDVGYTDTKAFRDVFKKYTSMSPVAYRNRYSKELALN